MRVGIKVTSKSNRSVGSALVACGLGAALLAGIAPAGAAGNVASGKKLYDNVCRGCHGDAKTQGTAPTLVGIIGRKAGTSSTGATSRALTESDITWDEANLKAFLASPGGKVHGTIMPIGVQRPADRDDLVAYLASLR